MTDEIIKINKDTVEVITKTIIRLNVIKTEIQELEAQRDSIKFIDYSKIKGLTQEIIDVINEENARREEQKSYFNEQIRMKQELLSKYD